jgi:retinol-binding protein 3
MLRFASLLLVSVACAGAQAAAIPDTPAGRTLQAWLDAFNSGDRARIQAYHAKYEPTGALDETVAFRDQTGGFELLGIDKSERLHIEFRVKEKASPATAVGKINLSDADPPVVVSFDLRAIPPGMTAADMNIKIDAATRARVIDGVVANLNEFYVYPESAKKMEEALRERQKKGAYDAVTDGEKFATMLTDDLQQVSHDKAPARHVFPRGFAERRAQADSR